MTKKLLFAAALALTAATANANNVQVANVSISGQNTASDYSLVNFDISWENSWRTSSNEANYDGCWVFVKFRKANSSLWQHATINYGTNGASGASGHTEPTGSTIKTPADGKGIWIHRDANGTGNVNYMDAAIRWNYGVDGVLDNDSVEVNVYAVEMVHATTGAFALGSGGTETGAFKAGNTSNPYNVISEAAITVGSGATNLSYSTVPSFSGDGLGPIPAAFPKGYNAFWIMKYEASEQQYVDFMNAIDAASATTRNPGYTGSANAYVAAFPERAGGSLNNEDVLAFLDWAAMRPMTEMEYEKACRGYNIAPVANEYAWGNTTLAATTSVYNPGTATETNTDGNATYFVGGANLNRPIRTGAYANDTTDMRTETGGSYYGGMEMSGNLVEMAVTAGNVAGRAFTGLHGDGYLSNTATANVTNWSANMLGQRGGSYGSFASSLRVSDREYATYYIATRQVGTGIRGVRTAE